jgi:hypothetical protein
MVPIILVDQLYSFDIDALIQAIPRLEQMAAEEFLPTAEEFFMRIIQMADNAGATAEHRALNYLAIRYPAIYATAAEQHVFEEKFINKCFGGVRNDVMCGMLNKLAPAVLPHPFGFTVVDLAIFAYPRSLAPGHCMGYSPIPQL